MKKVTMDKEQKKIIDNLVKHYIDNKRLFHVLLSQVEASVSSSQKLLPPLIHSVKSRLKDPDHLRDKLTRKMIEANEKNKKFTITPKDLFSRINDLAGFRIIHLHTKQFQEIDIELKNIFKEQAWVLHEGPIARTWDDEYREYFNQIGTSVNKSPDLYTSVHYIIKANSDNPLTCEIQVRTLMEEVWGEVDHTINYPYKSNSLSCREQIKVLARVTSSSSRLVDSIFSTHKDFHESIARKKAILKTPNRRKGKNSK
jgi:putative GTP pyrophosphokinase